MYNVLENKFSGQRYGHWHENVPPDFTEDYFKFITVRNPYTRFASAWYYASKLSPYCEIYEELMGHEMEIVYFLNWLIDNRDRLYHMKTPQGKLYQLSTILLPQYMNVEQRLNGVKIDRFIKMEDLLNEINNLPFVSPNRKISNVPKLYSGAGNKEGYKTWDEIKTPEVLLLVNEYVKGDFKLLSYAKEKPLL